MKSTRKSMAKTAKRLQKTMKRKPQSTEHKRIEVLLFTSTEPIKTENIAISLGLTIAETKSALRKLKESYKNSALALTTDTAGWRFTVRAQYRKARIHFIETPSLELPQQSQPAPVEVSSEHSDAYREFLDDLNEKIAMISHHNTSTSEDEKIRTKMLSDIEGFLHAEEVSRKTL